MQRRVIRIRNIHRFVSIFFSRITESSQQNTDKMNNRSQSKKKKKKKKFICVNQMIGIEKEIPERPFVIVSKLKARNL